MTPLRGTEGHSLSGVSLRAARQGVRPGLASWAPLPPQGTQLRAETPLSGTSLGGSRSQGTLAPSRSAAFLCESSERSPAPGARSGSGCRPAAALAQIPQASGSRARRRPAPQCHPSLRTAEATPRAQRTLRAAAAEPPASNQPSQPRGRACGTPPGGSWTPGPGTAPRGQSGQLIGPDARLPRVRAMPLARARGPDKGSGGGGR